MGHTYYSLTRIKILVAERFALNLPGSIYKPSMMEGSPLMSPGRAQQLIGKWSKCVGILIARGFPFYDWAHRMRPQSAPQRYAKHAGYAVAVREFKAYAGATITPEHVELVMASSLSYNMLKEMGQLATSILSSEIGLADALEMHNVMIFSCIFMSREQDISISKAAFLEFMEKTGNLPKLPVHLQMPRFGLKL